MKASLGKPKPVAAISATTYPQMSHDALKFKFNGQVPENKEFYSVFLQRKKKLRSFTSIADIILSPHKSIVSCQSGNPSGITGSEFNSYNIKVNNHLNLLCIEAYTEILLRLNSENSPPESEYLMDGGQLSTCIAIWDQALQGLTAETLPASSIVFLSYPHPLDCVVPPHLQVSHQPALPIQPKVEQKKRGHIHVSKD